MTGVGTSSLGRSHRVVSESGVVDLMEVVSDGELVEREGIRSTTSGTVVHVGKSVLESPVGGSVIIVGRLVVCRSVGKLWFVTENTKICSVALSGTVVREKHTRCVCRN